MALRWEDERYVRLYTRNLPEWLDLSWQARGLFALLLREVDRAGILPLGKLGLPGLARTLRAEWSEIEGPLAELLEDGCVQADEGQIVIPNFLRAQEVRQTDAQRKRDQRERDRVAAVSQTTKCHQQSPAVTAGHTESPPVTPSLALPILAGPNPPIVPQGTGGFVLSAESEKPVKRSRKDWPPPVVPDWLPLETWDAWLDYRKRGKGAYTTYAQHLTLKSLGTLRAQGHDPVAVLEQSIRRSWTDVFPVGGARQDAAPPRPTTNDADIRSRMRPAEEDPDA